MRGEVIAIGDELTTGQRLDTNSQWLAERLTGVGVEVLYHTTVADDLDANIAVFRAAIERADVVVATGGLGPTADDLTRDALAAAVGVGLWEDPASLDHIRRLFAARGREMPERNVVQAHFPVGAMPIANEHGTAPGVAMEVARPGGRGPCRVYALPGVPAEMRPMFEAVVLPAVVAAHPAPRVIRHRRVKCFGVGESQLEAMLPDMIRRGREPRVGITVSDATITLRVTATGPDDAACEEAMRPTLEEIHRLLGALVFGAEEDELHHVVVRLLAARGQTLATQEVATAGLLSRWLAEADPDRRVATSAEVAAALDGPAGVAAQRLRGRTGADYAVVIGGLDPAADAPRGAVQVAVAYDGGERSQTLSTAGHPALVAPRTAKHGLNLLRLLLLDRDAPAPSS